MIKTETKEPKEVVTFSYLQNRKVKLMPVKRPNSWNQKFRIEKNGSEINDSGFMYANAKSWISVPLDRKTGLLVQVFDNTTRRKTVEYPDVELTEQEFFERKLGLSPGDLDPNKSLQLPNGTRINDSFWKKIEGTVTLMNESIELDLSIPHDMLRYKVLATHFRTLIAPSLKDQGRKSTYRYVIMDIEQIYKEENAKLNLEIEATSEFHRISNDINKMLEVIWMRENKISESTNIEYVKSACYKIAKESPSEFLAILKSPYREDKILLLKAVKKGVIVRTKEQTYRLRDGFDIGVMEAALKWLSNPENFDRRELIKDQIKMAS